MLRFTVKIKRVTTVILAIGILLPILAWGGRYLKKLKLSKRYKAVYSCTINEDYWVDQSNDSIVKKEQMKSTASMLLNQELLSNENNVLQVDYLITKYNRLDSLIRRNTIDTISNRGEVPRSKNILYFTDKGDFLSIAIESKGPKSKTRDYENFYSASKQLIYTLNDSALRYPKWHTNRTDTVLSTGFKLIFSYPLTWELGAEKDTLGLHCVAVKYSSPVVDYFAINNMMKALGIETAYKGIAAINGEMLIEKRTGRVIKRIEDGSFIGSMEMKTSGDNTSWPSEYRYNKHYVLDSLIKKPREKILGIF